MSTRPNDDNPPAPVFPFPGGDAKFLYPSLVGGLAVALAAALYVADKGPPELYAKDFIDTFFKILTTVGAAVIYLRVHATANMAKTVIDNQEVNGRKMDRNTQLTAEGLLKADDAARKAEAAAAKAAVAAERTVRLDEKIDAVVVVPDPQSGKVQLHGPRG